MSKVLALRQAIMDAIDTLEDVREVDWYDGVFDQKDIEEWSLKTPAVFVSVNGRPGLHHSTGEMLVDIDVAAVVICQDANRPRSADGTCWVVLEKIAALANLNTFGHPDASASCDVAMKRLVDPELRREGVAVGVIKWKTNLTLGRNRFKEREHFFHNGSEIQPWPARTTTQGAVSMGPATGTEVEDQSHDPAYEPDRPRTPPPTLDPDYSGDPP